MGPRLSSRGPGVSYRMRPGRGRGGQKPCKAFFRHPCKDVGAAFSRPMRALQGSHPDFAKIRHRRQHRARRAVERRGVQRARVETGGHRAGILAAQPGIGRVVMRLDEPAGQRRGVARVQQADPAIDHGMTDDGPQPVQPARESIPVGHQPGVLRRKEPGARASNGASSHGPGRIPHGHPQRRRQAQRADAGRFRLDQKRAVGVQPVQHRQKRTFESLLRRLVALDIAEDRPAMPRQPLEVQNLPPAPRRPPLRAPPSSPSRVNPSRADHPERQPGLVEPRRTTMHRRHVRLADTNPAPSARQPICCTRSEAITPDPLPARQQLTKDNKKNNTKWGAGPPPLVHQPYSSMLFRALVAGPAPRRSLPGAKGLFPARSRVPYRARGSSLRQGTGMETARGTSMILGEPPTGCALSMIRIEPAARSAARFGLKHRPIGGSAQLSGHGTERWIRLGVVPAPAAQFAAHRRRTGRRL